MFSAFRMVCNLFKIKYSKNMKIYSKVEELTRTDSGQCIKFVPHSIEDTFIRIINDTGCYSFVSLEFKQN